MTESSHRISICPDLPSLPDALLWFRIRISEIISLFSILMWSFLLSVRKARRGLHCEKKLLKYCTLFLQSKIN